MFQLLLDKRKTKSIVPLQCSVVLKHISEKSVYTGAYWHLICFLAMLTEGNSPYKLQIIGISVASLTRNIANKIMVAQNKAFR